MIRPGGSTNVAVGDSVAIAVQGVPRHTMDVQHDVALNMEKTSEAAAAPSRILFLDGVRGLAALLVVTQHSHEYMQDLNLGACAVDAFFVLSSFLLTMLFMKKSMKLLAHGATYRKWTFTLADYFSKRFFRIYPLFALVATVLWMLPHDVKRGLFRVEKPESFDLYRVLTFDFDQRFFVFWTLPLAICYYLFIPVFVLAVLKLRSYWWIPFSSAYCWVMYEGWYTFRWSHMGLAPHFPTFLAGSLAAVIFVKLDMWMKMNSVQLRPPLIYAIRTFECTAIALLLSLSFRGLFFYWIHANIAPQTAGFPFISVLLTVIFVIDILLPSSLSVFFENNALRHCGNELLDLSASRICHLH
ncbi:Acyltransferase family [Phytophthora infestans]|uniref:Acyltransferase family n=1 Tax=Phytophthora infestans TaxID=4787 RepID=A0A8S9U415_PHYIN|nr:Acyltransferase family [Phytophthora infestans]